MEELPRLPIVREVKVSINALPRVSSIAQSSYRMTPIELAKLKVQLYDLLEKRFIRPSNSS